MTQSGDIACRLMGDYLMKIFVTPCDGIGPEITAATMEVLKAADAAFGLGLEYHFEDTGFTSLAKFGTTLRDETIERARTFDGIILGHPRGPYHLEFIRDRKAPPPPSPHEEQMLVFYVEDDEDWRQ